MPRTWLSLSTGGLAVVQSFSPLSLFGGAQGVWYEPTDTATIFQDTTATSPVTTLGQSVKRINDKSPNNNHATEATNPPKWKSNSGTGRFLEFDGINQILQSSAFTFTQPFTRIYAYQQTASANGNTILADKSGTGVGRTQVTTDSGGLSDEGRLTFFGGGPTIVPDTASMGNTMTMKARVVTEIWNGATSKISLDGGAYVTGDNSSGVGLNTGGIALANLSYTTPSPAGIHIYGLLAINRVLTDPEIASTITYFQNKIALSTVTRLWCAEGDSITHGYIPSTKTCNGYPNKATYTLTKPTYAVNMASNSAGVTVWGGRAAAVDALKCSGTNILSILPGNDDYNGSTQADLITYLDARRAAGWKVILCTTLPRTTGGYNASRNTWNVTFRGWLSVHCDLICDFAADGTMGPDAAAFNTSLYGDGIHPTAAGYANLEPIIRPIVDGI